MSDRELEIFIQLDMWRSRMFDELRYLFSKCELVLLSRPRVFNIFSDRELEICPSSLPAPHVRGPSQRKDM